MMCVRAQDWEGVAVSIFENHQDCWVLRVEVASVDSLSGLLAYMNVFARCNELVNKYGLVKVRRHVCGAKGGEAPQGRSRPHTAQGSQRCAAGCRSEGVPAGPNAAGKRRQRCGTRPRSPPLYMHTRH